MALSIAGALVPGWMPSRTMRFWLCLGASALVVIWAITPKVFGPMINQQCDIATGKAVVTRPDAVALTARRMSGGGSGSD